MRWIFWIDLDAYYVSCELRDRPELRGRPVIVGPDPSQGPTRGVVLSASYEARKFGVRSALPVGRAAQLCPQATWVPADFPKYERVAGEVRHLLRERYPRVVPRSIDEATIDLDLPDAPSAESEARAMQREVLEHLDLPASIGVSPSAVVAKIASDRAKPAGVVIVASERIAEFLAPLSVRVVPGVGPKTEAILHASGIEQVGQLAHGAPPGIDRALGDFAKELVALARGHPHDPIEEEPGPHSRSVDRTFVEDLSELEQVEAELSPLIDSLSEGIGAEGLSYQTVRISVRWDDFQRVQRGHTLPASQFGPGALRAVAPRLLAQLWEEEHQGRRRRVRLLSVGVERLRPRPKGQRLLEESPPSGQD
ncbi:MAG: DNA polymerase IV [Thermoplasmata archaeon]|nr:DNA polymerase IV [Thermoplasmata archaeon]